MTTASPPAPPSPPGSTAPRAALLDRALVGRQPLVDEDGEVVGFVVVHRTPLALVPTDPPVGAGDAFVTVGALLACPDLDLDDVVGNRDVWCDVDRDLLLAPLPLALPPGRGVLQLDVGELEDDAVRRACAALRAAGHRIAVRAVGAAAPDLLGPEVLDLVHAVTIDPRDAAVAAAVADACAGHEVLLVAQGCTGPADVAAARALGCALVQGATIPVGDESAVEVPGASALTQARLALELLRPEMDVHRVETILRPEPGLVAQLLHMAGSGAAGGLRRQVRSLREALVLLGSDRLRLWAALAVLGRRRPAAADALTTALVRARTCELLAQRQGIDGDAAFTVGLLSSLDLVLGRPLAELEDGLDLDGVVAGAAFHDEGPLGALVARCRDWEAALDRDDRGDLEMVRAMAFCWATSLVSALDSGREAVSRTG